MKQEYDRPEMKIIENNIVLTMASGEGQPDGTTDWDELGDNETN